MRRTIVKSLLIVVASAVAVLGADNSFGTWKLNTEKSKSTGAPMPVKSLTLTREAAGGGVKVTATGEQADGSPVNATYTAKFDGKEVQITGNAPFDLVSLKQENANRFTEERRKAGGSYKATARTAISNGGKTMTTTAKGTNTDGKEFTTIFVFDKQ
jgi:hypothetical protein